MTTSQTSGRRPNTAKEDRQARVMAVACWWAAIALALRIGYNAGFADGQRAVIRAMARGWRSALQRA